MKIIVSDACCLIDLRKGGLLEAFLKLPYEIVIPDVIFHQELIRFTAAEKALLSKHANITSLDGSNVAKAASLLKSMPVLSVNDAFAYITAETLKDSILLTGEAALRTIATSNGIDVHGILWVMDQLHIKGIVTGKKLVKVLTDFELDTTVRLPSKEVKVRIKKYSA